MEYRNGQAIPGTQYRFIRELGAGGHGTVYAVEHTFLEAPAVMKLLHAELVDRDDLAQRMTREARTLAKLRHPNIVEVKDGGISGEAPPRPYFVMESLNGMPLRDLLRQLRGPAGIGILAAIRIMIGMLEGLEHAHRAGVVHRDVKPDNIFLHRASTDLTVPKILDFGIAHLLMAQRTTGRYFLGTPRYAAPEQLRGDAPTPRTDIYSAGLVLYEMLAGEVPYAGITEIGDIMKAHIETPLPSVQQRCPEVPLYLANFVAAMVEKDPANRLPTAFAGAVALREIRARIENEQAGVINDTGFRTEPAPVDSLMFRADRDSAALAQTRVPAAKFDPNAKTRTDGAVVSGDTVIDSRPAGAGTAAASAAPGATPVLRTTVVQAPRVVGGGVQHSIAHAATEFDLPQVTPPMHIAKRAGAIDRNAATNTAAPFMPRSRANFDTERLIDGLGDAPPGDFGAMPSPSPPMQPMQPMQPEHTTGQIAMSRNASLANAPVVAPNALRRQMTAFAITLGVLTLVLVPVFLKVRKVYAPAPAAATSVAPPAAAPAPTPSILVTAEPAAAPVPVPVIASASAAAVVTATATAAPKPAVQKPKKPVVDPNDPSTVPFE